MQEAILEPLLRRMRISRVLSAVSKYPECRLLDVGCGFNYRLLRYVEPYISEGWGIDRKAPEVKNEKLTVLSGDLGKPFPFESGSFDVVTMLAVLEHVDDPVQVVREIERVLRPGGRLVITVPSVWAKPVLEFLAFRVGLVSKEEILDHKRYFTKDGLGKFIDSFEGLTVESLYSFQVGFNLSCTAVRN